MGHRHLRDLTSLLGVGALRYSTGDPDLEAGTLSVARNRLALEGLEYRLTTRENRPVRTRPLIPLIECFWFCSKLRWPGEGIRRCYRKLTGLVAVLALLTLLAALPVVAQQDVGGASPGEGGSQYSPPDPASTVPASVGSDEGDASFLQYAPSGPGWDQAVPVCPEPAAPGTARCHSLVRTDTPSPQ